MALLMLALFIAVPIIEIAIFIQVGKIVGLWTTLALVVFTAVVGTALLRRQGLATLRRAQESMARNEMPLRELFDGACLLVSGVLLLTPGFVTDSLGALLLLPPVRELLRRYLAGRIAAGTIRMERSGGANFRDDMRDPFAGRPNGGAQGDIIDGEYEDVTESPESLDSPWRKDGGSGRR